ncbi:MAG: sucrase ferredoxin [Deltaproteobacteria bacterium]
MVTRQLPALLSCSGLARDAAEPLAGTAGHAAGCVLMSYPKRLWATDALASPGLPDALRAQTQRLALERDVVTRLIAPEGPWTGRTEVLFFPQGLRFRDVPLDAVGSLLDAAARDALPYGSEPVTLPVLACCTHGQRDRCCALHGFALARALREEASAAGIAVEVREASHLGGDRFAPSVLALPSGHMHGHVEPSQARALLEATARGEPLLERFRGSLWHDPLAQLVEHALWCLGGPDARDLLLGPPHERALGKTQCELRCKASWRGQPAIVVARCDREEHSIAGDCHSLEEGALSRIDRWRVTELWAEPTGRARPST